MEINILLLLVYCYSLTLERFLVREDVGVGLRRHKDLRISPKHRTGSRIQPRMGQCYRRPLLLQFVKLDIIHISIKVNYMLYVNELRATFENITYVLCM